MIFLAIQRELSSSNSVGVTAHKGAEERVGCQVAVEVVEAQRDVGHLTFAVRNNQGDNPSAVVRNRHFHPAAIGKGVKIDGLSVRHFSKGTHSDSRISSPGGLH